jgi:hypothetical protein
MISDAKKLVRISGVGSLFVQNIETERLNRLIIFGGGSLNRLNAIVVGFDSANFDVSTFSQNLNENYISNEFVGVLV